MTDTTTAPADPKKKSPRPSSVRILAGYYVDFLFVAFLSWVACFSFNGQSFWFWVTLIVWILEVVWCRDRLVPTAGEYIMGIRYMTSKSSHVVADIQVIHPKLVLNGYLLFGGVVDLSLSFYFLSGWTFLSKAVVLGMPLQPPWSLIYWVVSGLLFFLAASSLLGGSKSAVWLVPLIHAWFLADFQKSLTGWTGLLPNALIITPWVSVTLNALAKNQSTVMLGLFTLFSVYLLLVVAFSRKHLVN
jgi:hypothetical protein